jgi:hypothetical protein
MLMLLKADALTNLSNVSRCLSGCCFLLLLYQAGNALRHLGAQAGPVINAFLLNLQAYFLALGAWIKKAETLDEAAIA